MLRLIACVVLAFALAACDRPKPAPTAPAPKPEAPAARAVQRLERLADGTETKDCGHEAAERVRRVVRTIKDSGTLGKGIYPFCAILTHMPEVPAGLDGVMIHAVRGTNGIAAVEFVGADGQVLAKSPVKQGADVLGGGIERATAFVYITPSFLAPASVADPAVLKAGMIEGYPVIQVRGFANDTRVRLVGEDDTRSDAISFIHWSQDSPATTQSSSTAHP